MAQASGRQAYAHLADVYDRLSAGSFDYDAWCSFVLAQCTHAFGRLPRTACDAACGTGKMAIRLAGKGIRVVGCDASPAMLQAAGENARAAGLQIPFVCQNMTQLAVHKPVELVCCICDGVNYLQDEAALGAFFAAACQALVPGGLLVFDVSTPYKLQQFLGNNSYGVAEQDAAYIWDGQYDALHSGLDIALTLFVRQDDGRYTRHEEHHWQRAWTDAQLSGALQQAGLQIVGLFGDTFGPPADGDLRRHIVARRPE